MSGPVGFMARRSLVQKPIMSVSGGEVGAGFAFGEAEDE
jgi:hypothetical protein